MKAQLPATILLILGSLVFVFGAFLPVSRIYMMRTADERLSVMQGQRAQWHAHLGMMGGGAAVAAAGMALLPAGLAAPVAVPATIAAAATVAGTLLWLRHLQLRVTASGGFAGRTNPHWHFVIYTALMQIGLIALSVALLRGGAPTWMWVVPAAGTAVTVLAFLVFGDVPPFVHYVWLLSVGVGLLRTGAHG